MAVSDYEGFGLPVVEALARGMPVLTSDCTSLPEVSGGYAQVVDPRDLTALADGMKRLALVGVGTDDDAKRRRGWARQFTYVRAAEKYSRIIDRLLDEWAKSTTH